MVTSFQRVEAELCCFVLLRSLEDGPQASWTAGRCRWSEVSILGPWEKLTECAQMVLRAAVGDFQGIDVVELVHEAG